jgi:MoaA/NifB/PqqE/SkfB family radical SAM enzyme
MKWLELSPGFACNLQCPGCYSCSAADRDQMDWPEVLRWLQTARRRGAKHLWLSGGEPTLRKDFLATLRAAKHLGFERIKVQSNGLLFSYPQFAQKAVDAGMTEVNLLVKSLDPTLHDRMMQKPGALALLDRAIDVLRTHPGVRLEGDFLLTQRNFRELPGLVAHYAARGFRHFNIWLFSLADQGDADLRDDVPRLADTVPYLLRALQNAEAAGATLVSLNTPHCLLPPAAWRMQFDAAGMELLVVNPGGHTFMLEQSTFELGTYTDACTTCAVRTSCHGLRKDYIAVHGDGELAAVTSDAAAGHDPRGSTLDLSARI